MPLVSIIVPCYNEQATIRLLLDAFCRQTVAGQDMEIIIADGLSVDRTREEIALFQQQHPEMQVKIVDNPGRAIPSALNRAIEAAQGQYIVRLDAHSVPSPDYLERCIQDLEADRGENVGGVWEICPPGAGKMQRAIALAAAHPFGVGDARYRYTTQAGLVDTVPFGAFRREVFTLYGKFDETLLSNEDYEFNARLRQNGGRIWLDPLIRSKYFSRPNLQALAKQYWRYGYWKWRMLRRYPTTLRWRQALPPVFVLGVVALGLLALGWNIARMLLVAGMLFYFLVLCAGSIPAAKRSGDLSQIFLIPLAIATMHFSWGLGFWWSMLSVPKQKS